MTTIKLKNGSGAPTSGDLVQGEPALDLTNKRLYTEDSGGTVIEVGTNPTSVTTGDITATGTATFAGLTTTADVSFGDNDKAIFGAGSDLQIYHDGSNSYIENTAPFMLIESGTIVLRNTAGTEDYAKFNENSDVKLYFDNAQKFATTSTGIDVTGTAVTDGLTVAGTAQFDDYGGTTGKGRIQFGNSGQQFIEGLDTGNGGSGAYLKFGYGSTDVMTVTSTGIDVTGTVTADGLTVDGGTTFNQGSGDSVNIFRSTDYATLKIGANATDHFYLQEFGSNDLYLARVNSSVGAYSAKFASNGDISFYEDTGTTAKLFWDASLESLGIGTTSLTPTDGANIELSSSTSSRLLLDNTGASGRKYAITSDTSGNLGFYDYDASAFRILVDSSGDVGIGTSSPNIANFTKALTILDSAASNQVPAIELAFGSNTRGANIAVDNRTSVKALAITAVASDLSMTFGTNNTERMRIDSNGRVGIGTSSPARPLSVHSTSINPNIKLTRDGTSESLELGSFYITSNSNDLQLATSGSNDITLLTNNTERMRLDSSGNLLVGTTDDTLYNNTSGDGIRLSNGGEIQIANTNDIPLWLNRMGTDGVIVTISKSGTAVGSISVTSSATTYNTSSDQRLKDNIVDAPSASDDIDAIQVRSFDWKANGSHQKYGMVAQELESVAPEAVTGDADSDDMMGVDYSKLVPMMLKEIQSLRARVAQLEGEN